MERNFKTMILVRVLRLVADRTYERIRMDYSYLCFVMFSSRQRTTVQNTRKKDVCVWNFELTKSGNLQFDCILIVRTIRTIRELHTTVPLRPPPNQKLVIPPLSRALNNTTPVIKRSSQSNQLVNNGMTVTSFRYFCKSSTNRFMNCVFVLLPGGARVQTSQISFVIADLQIRLKRETVINTGWGLIQELFASISKGGGGVN